MTSPDAREIRLAGDFNVEILARILYLSSPKKNRDCSVVISAQIGVISENRLFSGL